MHNFNSDLCNLNKKVIVHLPQRIKNEHFNSWLLATTQLFSGNTVEEPLLEVVDSGDPMKLQS